MGFDIEQFSLSRLGHQLFLTCWCRIDMTTTGTVNGAEMWTENSLAGVCCILFKTPLNGTHVLLF